MLIRVLIVDDDHRLVERLANFRQNLSVDIVHSCGDKSFWDRLKKGDVDLVLIHRDHLGEYPAAWVRSLRRLPERPEIVVFSPQENARERATLLSSGCIAVLHMGLPDEDVLDVLGAILRRLMQNSSKQLRSDTRSGLSDFQSTSTVMQHFMEMVSRVSTSESSVLILGETGVGKERLAQAIHNDGRRSDGPFLAVNCGALHESLLESELFGHEQGAFTGATRTRRGYFELAHGGTLFLDEIGEMPLHLQVKLLRVLQERRIQRVGGERSIPVDVRIMAASNRDLETEVSEKRFRADLYFRLAVVTLTLPSLRERCEDIPFLVESYLNHFRAQIRTEVESIHPDALEAMLLYTWPGNVRELINVIERAVLLCEGNEITLKDLPSAIGGKMIPADGERESESIGETPLLLDGGISGYTLKELREATLDRIDRIYLDRVLRESGGRVQATAARAGLSERALYGLMRKLKLRKEDYR
ncbi:sigma-54-dependent Fis family transcriptional regulator [bacterium]|nr:sigma-54-dependent Fis family transcriptional regulator [bacterium]